MKIADTAAASRICAARIAPVGRLGMAGLLASCMLLAMVGSLRAQDPSEADVEPTRPVTAKKSVHDYTVSLRGGAWITWVDGEVKDSSGRGGNFDTIDLDDDLGFDEPTTLFVGRGNLRLGRHDFWVTGFSYDESEEEKVDFDLDFGDIKVGVNGRVVTDLKLVDVNFSYGYSFFTFEEDGFRLGPKVAVSYTSLDLEVTEKTTGESEEIDETFPAPMVGLHGEVPFGDFVLEARLAGVYFNTDSFDGWALRAGTDVVWRPVDYLGFFGGFNLIYTEISFNKEDIDAALFGPTIGLEVRF